MFDWLGSLFGNAFSSLGTQISSAIFDMLLKWMYEQIYNTVADFFTQMGNMGAEIFDLGVVQSTISLFTLFGWALFAAGTVVAVFDVAIEYQNGRASGQSLGLSEKSTELWKGAFAISANTSFGLFNILAMIAFAYCVIKIFFANIKRGGILLIQMAVGSLYMFSLPRGYQDGFNQWMKQVIAICLTAFMQTTLLYLGLLIFPKNMLLGLGVMLSANEVPRIAEQFGLDSSVKVNMMSVVHATTTAVNLTRSVARAAS